MSVSDICSDSPELEEIRTEPRGIDSRSIPRGSAYLCILSYNVLTMNQTSGLTTTPVPLSPLTPIARGCAKVTIRTNSLS